MEWYSQRKQWGVNTVPAKIGNGMELYATGSHITIPHSTDFNFSDGTQNFSFSMGCWVNFNVIKNTWLFSKRLDPTAHEWQIAYFEGNLRIDAFTGGSNTASIRHLCPFTPTTGEWYNIIASHNAITGESAIYVNGVELAGTDSGVGGIFNVTTEPLQLGSATTWSSVLTLNGILDEVWIKKHHHTTPEEALLIWNDGLGLTI